MTDDIGLITALLKNYEASANDGDAAALRRLYCDDAVLLPDRFDVFEGAERIEAFYAFAFSMLTLHLEFDIDPSRIVVAGDTAYATTTSTGTRFIKSANETVPEINRELWVFRNAQGAWKIARYCFNKAD
ncbi:MAG: SgcJ/EcaC family oxidoreductase [Pseudomonadota bacterium]